MNSYNLPDGRFFNEDYFERGVQTGISYYQDYRWMPRRSFKEALAIIDHLGLDHRSYVLDVGCAKGFIVKALRALEIRADGCDISRYALQFAPEGCWPCDHSQAWLEKKTAGYTHVFLKDVLEHGNKEQITDTLLLMRLVAPRAMCVIPMGKNGRYHISEYHRDRSHLTAENAQWWHRIFQETGWYVASECAHVPGIKDNWSYCKDGNRVFVLLRRDRVD